MLISNLFGPRPTPTQTPAPAPAANSGSTVSGGGTTSSGGTSQTATPAPTSTTPPSAPPQSSEPVQPTTAPPTTGTATSSSPTPPPASTAPASTAPASTAPASPAPAPRQPAAAPKPDVYISPEALAPQPRAGADALQLYTRQLSSGAFRPVPVAGTIATEVRRIETVETAEITKSELIKQASVAMLAQANLRQQDVLDILNV